MSFEIVDWMDHEDRVIDVYDGRKKVFSQYIDTDKAAERADDVEHEAQAMLAWAEYVRKIGVNQ